MRDLRRAIESVSSVARFTERGSAVATIPWRLRGRDGGGADLGLSSLFGFAVLRLGVFVGLGADLGVRLLVIGVVIVSRLSKAYRGQSRANTVKRRGETQLFGTMRPALTKMLQIAPNCQPTALWSEGFSSICRINATLDHAITRTVLSFAAARPPFAGRVDFAQLLQAKPPSVLSADLQRQALPFSATEGLTYFTLGLRGLTGSSRRAA